MGMSNYVLDQQELAEAHKRIKYLEAELNECLEYFEDHSDVVDGDYGEPAPNKEMQMTTSIKMALGIFP
jgi:hypothetical protein